MQLIYVADPMCSWCYRLQLVTHGHVPIETLRERLAAAQAAAP